MRGFRKELKEITKVIHDNAVKKGFWSKEVSLGTELMRIVTELGEALEADRKGHRASELWDPLDRANQRNPDSFIANFITYRKDTLEDELADAFIMLMSLVGELGIDLAKHVEAKIIFNSLRPPLHGKLY